MESSWLPAVAALLLTTSAVAADWVDVGADPHAKYYVDMESIKVDGENVSVLKRGIFTHIWTDTLDDVPTHFKETIGIVEIDCARRINRVTQIDMIGENGEVVWTSGAMKSRMWEEVRPNTHAQTAMELICARIGKS